MNLVFLITATVLHFFTILRHSFIVTVTTLMVISLLTTGSTPVSLMS